MRKTPAVAALRSQRAATLRRLAELPDLGWESECLPRWRVRDLVAHLVAVDEASVTGRLYQAVRSAEDRREFERWNDLTLTRWSDCSPLELLDALERWGDRLARLAARMPSPVFQLPFSGWHGRQPLLYLLYRRVLDEWVHECDVAWSADAAAGREPVAPPPGVPDVLAAAVLATLPHLSLARVARSSGVVRMVVDTGDDGWRTWSVDFARRQYGKRVTARPDSVVRTDACTLALLAENRWRAAGLPAGRITIEGDEGIAADLLDVVAPAP